MGLLGWLFGSSEEPVEDAEAWATAEARRVGPYTSEKEKQRDIAWQRSLYSRGENARGKIDCSWDEWKRVCLIGARCKISDN